MEVFGELVEIKNSCIGLGFFDGVHLAHRELIKELVSVSKENGSKSVIISFKKSPAELFTDMVKYLTRTEEKRALISELGVDYIVELDFNEELAKISAEDYLKNVLINYFSPKYILTGFNHTFGRGKCGNAKFLQNNQQKYGYIYKEIAPFKYKNEIVSSTRIKSFLSQGNIESANSMLGHDFMIYGTVIEGNKIGRTIGFPTANIIYPDNKVEIPFGVYRVNVCVHNNTYRGMMNFGIKPTINNGENKPVAEVHIIGFNKDIYGENIDISVLNKIRDEKRFNSLEELKNQINEDLKLC